MGKQVLKIGSFSEEDFILIGIVCQHKDYRLCHYLNQALNIQLRRNKDYEIIRPRNRQPLAFSFFTFEPEERERYFFFANKTAGGTLIPENKGIDYFFMVKEYENCVTEEDLLKNIKSIPFVLGAYLTDKSLLRSKENLIF